MSDTREHPILFSGPMVRAILEGRKMQTRRVIVPQPTNMQDERRQASVMADATRLGAPGERLWVRETFAYIWGVRLYKADGIEKHDGYPIRWCPSIHMPRHCSRLMLRITEVRVQRLQEISEEDAEAEGIIDEGMGAEQYRVYGQRGEFVGTTREPLVSFASLWDSINGKRGYSWGSNPWVRAVTFGRVYP